MEFLASINEAEQRIEARVYVCGYMMVDDTITGLVESEIESMEWESEEQKEHTYADFYNEFGADEIYEGFTGQKPPSFSGAEFYEGDLYLYAFADCDPDDPQSIREAYIELKDEAKAAGCSLVWLDGDDARKAGMGV